MDNGELRLVKLARKGDREAFTQLVVTNERMLSRVAMATLKNPDDAADAVQDTVLQAWESLGQLRQARYFKTWVVRILLNKCADIQRGQSHYAFVEELPESAEEPDWDTRVDVRRAMAKLGDQDQLILSLFYYDDFSVRQIAEALSLSEGAVRTRLTRSRDRFKKSFLQEKGECL